jgi:hypothetical protein
MRHAAVRRWPSTAGIWRQPSARRKRIWPLATRPRSTTSAASSSAGYLESSPAAGAPRRLPLVLGELDEREQFLAPLREAADDAGAAAPPLPLEGRGAALGRREAFRRRRSGGSQDRAHEDMGDITNEPIAQSVSLRSEPTNPIATGNAPTMGTGAPERRASLLSAGWVGDTTPCECSAHLPRDGPRPRRLDLRSRARRRVAPGTDQSLAAPAPASSGQGTSPGRHMARRMQAPETWAVF